LSTVQLQTYWTAYVTLKAAVPERILCNTSFTSPTYPTGSRADTREAAVWKDGTWTLEYKRALDTGHPEDDVIFNDLSRPYYFGVAWMDNTDGAYHIPFGVLKMVFAACDSPLLGLSRTGVYWFDYADYTARTLSVDYSVANEGANGVCGNSHSYPG